MALIDLLRHGDTGRRGILLGRTDDPLSGAGWAQIERQIAGRSWSRAVASPLRRARDPAAKLAQERDLPLRIDADWAELDFGAWDGRPIAELRADPETAARLDEFYARRDAPAAPDGETWQALLTRIERALSRLLDDDAPSTLVVTHAGPIRATLAVACGLPFASLWALRIDYGTRVTLRVERSPGSPIWGEIVEIVQA
jgi:alpha-ribazole phosphatase